MRHVFAILMILAFGSTGSLSQCVREKIVISSLRGQVIDSFNGEPLSRVRIAVLHRNVEIIKPLAETLSDEGGQFDLPEIKKGDYLLSISYPYLEKIVTRLKLTKRRQNYLKVSLAVPDFSGTDSCEGSVVAIEGPK